MSFRANVVKDEDLSRVVKLRTSDLLDRDEPQDEGRGSKRAVAGFQYDLSVGPERDVHFHLDIAGSQNVELMQGTGTFKKTEVPAGSVAVCVARIMVIDRTKSWTLQCKYTWTEKEKQEKKVADGIFLETVDMWTKGRMVTSIDYRLRNETSKRISFTLDFRGSENLELATGGLIKKVVAEPNSTTDVAYLQVIKATVPWTLKCKYEWCDEAPERPVLGVPERKELSPGITLITTRSESGGTDTFKYQLACSKNVIVDFRLDCSECDNMNLKDEDLLEKRTVVQPWDRVEVGTVSVINPTRPWSLRCKFHWSERSPKPPSVTDQQGSPMSSGSAIGNESGINFVDNKISLDAADLGSAAATGAASKSENLKTRQSAKSLLGLEEADVSSFSKSSAAPVHFSLRAPPPPPAPDEQSDEGKVDCKEIGQKIFLTSTQIPGRPTIINYELEVRKSAKVVITIDFNGSSNLLLEESQDMRKTCAVMPFKKTEIAKLRVVDCSPGATWALRCKYTFEEQDVTISESSSSRSLPVSGDEKSEHLDIDTFLKKLSLAEHIPLFKSEQIDFNLLVEMSSDELALRETLKELGVSKIGPREKIITELRKHQ